MKNENKIKRKLEKKVKKTEFFETSLNKLSF